MAFDTRVHFRDQKTGRVDESRTQPYRKIVKQGGVGGISERYIRNNIEYYSNGDEVKLPEATQKTAISKKAVIKPEAKAAVVSEKAELDLEQKRKEEDLFGAMITQHEAVK